MSVLELQELSIRFGGVQAAKDVSMKIGEYEIVGVIGPNGAGKTTTFNMITGFYAPNSGKVLYRGEDVTGMKVHDRAALGMGRTFQNVGLVKGSTVRENLLTSQHLSARYGVLAGIFGSPTAVEEEKVLRRRADTILEVLRLGHLADTQVAGLPYGDLKRVEIATVLATDPDLLLLDEPSSGMGPEEAHQLGDTLLDLRREFALTIMMIEHHVPLVVRVCDYVYCLNFGELLAEGLPDEVRHHPDVVRAYLGEDAETDTEVPDLMPFLEVRDLEVGYGFPVLMKISFEVEQGETCVLFGLNGAGKTTTVATIAGLLSPDAGSIALDGEAIGGLSAAALVERGVALVPEGRRVFPGLSISNNLRLGGWTKRKDTKAITEMRERVFDWFPRLAERAEQPAGTLSGGEQQMLAIGRAMMSGPRLLLIDEASLGLSPALAKTVFEVVSRINEDGVTVVIVEQNVGVLPYADRALIMEKGTIVYSGVGDEIRSADLRGRYLGASA